MHHTRTPIQLFHEAKIDPIRFYIKYIKEAIDTDRPCPYVRYLGARIETSCRYTFAELKELVHEWRFQVMHESDEEHLMM